MEKYYDLLINTVLFKNITVNELDSILKCLKAKKQSFKKNEFIVLPDTKITFVGIILQGSVQVLREDISGNRVIVDELSDGELFGETLACSQISKSPVAVMAVTECEVLFIDYNRITSVCSSACDFHTKLIQNMLMLISQKNIMLNNKLDIISKKTIREKLFAYFTVQINKNGSNKFEIQFSRDELADYLSVNRSAMSRELCKMRDENILRFNKSSFEIMI